MITLKTSVLLACSLKMGALVGGAMGDKVRVRVETANLAKIQINYAIMELPAQPKKRKQAPTGKSPHPAKASSHKKYKSKK
jgi:hypothetical protein